MICGSVEYYFEAPIKLPERQKGQSYKEYDKDIDVFFENYKKNYIWKGTMLRPFLKVFKEDFLDDPNYNYIIKYLYKKNKNLLEHLRLWGCLDEAKKEIRKKNSQKKKW